MSDPNGELQCTTREFVSSFRTPLDAMFWMGGATFKDYVRRDAEIAHARMSQRASRAAYLVFDVETDGGAGKQLAIQLGFVVFDANHAELFSHEALLRLPKGRRISWHATRVHKITDNKLHLRGVDPAPELSLFFQWVDRVVQVRGGIIAHNAAFDASVITNTAEACGVHRMLNAKDCTCTMRQATLPAGLLDRRGNPKPPRNKELYMLLHNGDDPSKWARLHSAADDARVTAASYRAGCDLGWWH
tara:strand:- start:148 stop:885 length:738 start_codon:yes stop_codon:yes gene_type:complete